MSGKEHPHSSIARRAEHFDNLCGNSLRVFELTRNSNLHVIDEQSDPLRIAHLFQRLRDANAVSTFHNAKFVMDVYRLRRARATSVTANDPNAVSEIVFAE